MFKKAIKVDAKLRLSIQGPAGAGKTYTALTLATHLANGEPIAVIDTEHGSASKYADLFSFDVLEMEAPFHPDKFCEAIRDAAQGGYKVVIIDSMTHAWNGEGGMLDIVNRIAKQKYSGNTYVAWNDATPIQKKLIEAIVGAPIHVIATMRSKMDYVLEVGTNGKSSPKKLGMAPEQRGDLPYEFDIVFDMNVDNEANVTKTRCPALTGELIKKPGKAAADTIKKWLSGNPAPIQQPSAIVAPVKPIATPTPETRQPVAIEAPHTNGTNGTNSHNVDAIVAPWKTPSDAQAWAVKEGHTDNEFSARTRWATIVKEQFEGKYTPAKFGEIAKVYVIHYLTKTAEPVAA